MDKEFKKLNRIKELRLAKGVTQKEVAEAVGISQGMLTNYETGKRSPRDKKVWEELAAYFSVDVPYLMGISGTINHQQAESTILDLALSHHTEETDIAFLDSSYKLSNRLDLLGFSERNTEIPDLNSFITRIVNLNDDQLFTLLDFMNLLDSTNKK